MGRRRTILVAGIASVGALFVLALGVLFAGSAGGECVLSYGRLDFTARNGLLITRLFRDEDTRWESPVAYCREYTLASVTWWSFDAGRGRSGWKPMREVDYLILPIWVLIVPPLLVTGACGRVLWRGWSRRRRQQCERCGYARGGLAEAAPCPECGRRVSRDVSQERIRT